MSTERRVKITIRMTAPQRADIESAARKFRTTVNKYALESMLARRDDDALFERVKALLEVKFIAIAAEFAAFDEQQRNLTEQQRDIAQTQERHLKEAVNWIGARIRECIKGNVPK